MGFVRWALVGLFCAMTAGSLRAKLPLTDEGGLERLDFREVVALAKEKVFPAVVFVKCTIETLENGEKSAREVSGSGVIVSREGHVLTNWHVIDRATSIRCMLQDGRAMDAKLLGSDKDTDMAVLKLQAGEADGPLPHARLGDSAKLKEGDFVMAMGAPWGMSRSVSIGIVSCTRRYLPGKSEYSLWLQTDATICPGNSGGPLVNTDGEIIGINTLGVMMGGDIGFAVPSETVAVLYPQLRDSGAANWTWTGLQLQAIRDFNRNMYFDGADGVIVSDTDPQSPARLSGLMPRDRIMRVNGQAVSALHEEDLPAVRRMLAMLPCEQPARLDVLRGEEVRVLELTPRTKGKVEGDALECSRWDFSVKAINQFDNPDLHFYRESGVFVFGVKHPGNAAGSDLRPQDIILSIDGEEIQTLQEVKAAHAKAMENVTTRSRIRLSILRNGMQRQVVVDFSRDYSRE